MAEVSYVLQERSWGVGEWKDNGDEVPAVDDEMRARIEELRDLWGHDTEYRVIRIKRKALDL